jgi:NADH-quinone oxidoreductase subunit G
MTATSDAPGTVVPSDHISATIDDIEVSVPKGTLVIRAAEQIGIEIPRFCDHPLLDPVAACRMCLIEIEGMPKPQPACAIQMTDGMVVRTQLTSTVADVAQKGVMEFLLINHPLDCPICDKGGECPLQNQAMTAGRGTSRFDGKKRTFPKPINVSAQVLLDRERCVSCARCTRFADEIAGDPFIELLERGAKQQVGIAKDHPFDSYFAGNTIQICPVGALTSAGYRFRARPFDLVSTPTVCEHCASGCSLRTDARRGVVMRRLAGDDPAVNEEWNCDKGRFGFEYLAADRLTTPMIREDGQLRPASWPEAIEVAARGLRAAVGHTAVLTGGRLTQEDAYTYGKFARVALGTDDIDFRARPTSAEEGSFLAEFVAGTGLGVTYEQLQSAPVVVLVGLEPEEESPIIFLRLRKAVDKGNTKVVAVAPWQSPGFEKTSATLIPTAPGAEPETLHTLADPGASGEIAELLRQPGAVVLVGERLGSVPGGLSAAVSLAQDTGADLAWVPRRAGERGALDAGALAGVLPGGRPLADPGARAEVASAWGVAADALPNRPGRDLLEILDQLTRQAATDDTDEPQPGRIDALVMGGWQAGDLPDPEGVLAALRAAGFVVQLTLHEADITATADVVFPVKADAERAGSYTDWEGRVRRFGQVFRQASGYTDSQVLALLARDMGSPIGEADNVDAAKEMASLGEWNEARNGFQPHQPDPNRGGGTRLATWRQLLDDGVMQQGDPYLAATARPVVARISAATAARVGVNDGDTVTVHSPRGSVSLSVIITDMVDDTVWLPTSSAGSDVYSSLGVPSGAEVELRGGGSL